MLERLSDLFVRRGVPEHTRSDNGSEFTARCVREWPGRVGVKTPYIELRSPWENGSVENYNGKLRDELLKRESCDTLLDAKVLIERWRQVYNTVRPHSALGYRPPAPEARQPCAAASATPQRPHRAGRSEGESLTSRLVSHWGAGQLFARLSALGCVRLQYGDDAVERRRVSRRRPVPESLVAIPVRDAALFRRRRAIANLLPKQPSWLYALDVARFPAVKVLASGLPSGVP